MIIYGLISFHYILCYDPEAMVQIDWETATNRLNAAPATQSWPLAIDIYFNIEQPPQRSCSDK
jgi:hypothetical protein